MDAVLIMYKHFFGLQREPFGMAPDPSFLLLTPSHREALAGLTYAIMARKGFVVLTGEAGTGKTTLLTRVLESLPSTVASVSVVLNPALTPREFLEMVLLEFGITDVPASKTQWLVKLHQLLMETRSVGRLAVLLVDEAHRLSAEVLEEIRLLSNFELADGKLLQIVLAGQPELAQTLNREDLRQLKQRIAVRLSIRPLSTTEVHLYIGHRWAKAGSTESVPFTGEAVEGIAEFSRGIPRIVNTICDNSLLLAYGEGIRSIGVAQVSEAAKDLDLAPGIPEQGARNYAANSADASATDVVVMPTLERETAPAPKPPLLSRWMGKRKIAAGRTSA